MNRDDEEAIDTVNIGKFNNGMNNVSPDTDLPEGSLVSAINVNIDKEGNVFSRKGYEQLYAGDVHSLYNRYFVEGSKLKYLEEDNTATVISTGLSETNYLAWETILGDYYYSDGTNNKVIDKGEWGVASIPNNPTLWRIAGKLNAGIYQVILCYKNSSGERGGASLSSTITVVESSGIVINDIPVSPEGYDTIAYVSTTNGEELYQNGIILNGVTSYTVIDSRKSTNILDTQFMEPLPGGHILRHFKARLYVANDNVLWFSEAYRYGLRKTGQDFFQFPAKIKIVQPVTDGLYVVADKTYFLQGTDPKKMNQIVVSTDSAIEGTGITVGGYSFGLDTDTEVGYWFSEQGAVLGMPAGQLKQLTLNKVAIEENMQKGTTLYKEINGIKQMVTNFNGGNASDLAFDAQATSFIIRNGVIIT